MAKKVTKTQAKKAAKAAKKHPKIVIAIVVIVLLIVIAAVVLYFVKPDLYHKYLGVGGHAYTEWETTEASCNKDGVKTRYCTVCGEEESEVIPATHAHAYGEWQTTEPTCGADGKRERSCADCGKKDTEVLPATGNHSYGEWTTTDPTCGEDGKRERLCHVCNDKETEPIPATGKHNYTETVMEPTCGEDGKRERVCSVCYDKQVEIIPATGKHIMGPDNVCTVCGYDPNAPAKASDFSIHFLEIGKYTGDCVLIDCGDTELLIDAGSRKGSAETIKKYIDKYCDDGVLEYVISTHSDEDHIAALIGSKSGSTRTGIAYQYQIGTYIKFDKAGKDGNGKPLTTDKGNVTLYGEYEETVNYLIDKGTAVYTASQCYEEKDGAKRQYYLDENHTVSFNILYNYYYYNASSDENNYSVVTLLTEELSSGNRHYLFTGDLEESGESKMVDYYKNAANSKSEYDILPEVELYKAGHHGSKTSSTDKLLKVIKPKSVVVCCCCGATEYTKVNENTFPTQTMVDNVGKYTDKIYVTTLATGLSDKDANGNYTSLSYGGYTSMNGDIVFYTENGELKLRCSNNTTILKDTEWFKENRTWNGV